MALNAKQRRFVAEYCIDLCASAAAIRAGYSSRTARQQGHRLLTHADIQAAIAEAQEARQRRTEISQDRVLEELASIAFMNVGDYLTIEHGVASISLEKVTPEAMRAVRKIRQREVLVGDAETGGVVQVTDFETHDKLKALGLLSAHMEHKAVQQELAELTERHRTLSECKFDKSPRRMGPGRNR